MDIPKTAFSFLLNSILNVLQWHPLFFLVQFAYQIINELLSSPSSHQSHFNFEQQLETSVFSYTSTPGWSFFNNRFLKNNKNKIIQFRNLPIASYLSSGRLFRFLNGFSFFITFIFLFSLQRRYSFIPILLTFFNFFTFFVIVYNLVGLFSLSCA